MSHSKTPADLFQHLSEPHTAGSLPSPACLLWTFVAEVNLNFWKLVGTRDLIIFQEGFGRPTQEPVTGLRGLSATAASSSGQASLCRCERCQKSRQLWALAPFTCSSTKALCPPKASVGNTRCRGSPRSCETLWAPGLGMFSTSSPFALELWDTK